mgnify:CR=1 FL=1
MKYFEKKYFFIIFRYLYEKTITALFLPFLVLFRFLSYYFKFSLCKIDSGELGHFYDDFILMKYDQNLKNKTIFFWLSGKISNTQVEIMFKREYPCFWWVKYLYLSNELLPFSEKFKILSPRNITGSRDTQGIVYQRKNKNLDKIEFLIDEHETGLKYLKNVGFKDGDKFICLIIRDPDYKRKLYPDIDWSYHDYRDSTIENYQLAARNLANKGYWIFRMGKFSKKKFECNHPKIIDYATSNARSDFLDIWLTANCYFFVTNGTGLDSVADKFEKPLVCVNWLPITHIISWSHANYYFKKLRFKGVNKTFSLEEYLEHDYLQTQKYHEKNIEYQENSPEEINQAILEMENKLTQSFKEDEKTQILQKSFWDKMKKNIKFNKLNSFIHPKANVSGAFLKNNQNWL